MTTVKQLSQQTGLTVSFIRKCLDSLPDILKQHTQRGSKNAVLIDANGLVIFERIRQLKQEGRVLPDIKTALETELQPDTHDTQQLAETETSTPTTQQEQLLTELLTVQTRLSEEQTARLNDTREHDEQRRKEQERYFQELSELQRKNDALTSSIRMLPEGKTPQEVRAEYEEQRRELSEKERKEQEASRILAALRDSQGILQGKRRKELLTQLEKLLTE